MPPEGGFIVLEGLDGSGKSTQAERLVAHLREQGHPVKAVEEPGGTPEGETIRELLLQKDLTPLAELFLYEASRNQLVRRVIRPALEQGEIVVCQRYDYSTVAYQGYGRGLPLELIECLNGAATEGVRPDVVLFLDVPAEEGLARLREGRRPDRIEDEGLRFLQRVERGYQELLRRCPEMVRIDGTRSPEAVFQEICGVVEKVLTRKSKRE
jgi:dTMP kinase